MKDIQYIFFDIGGVLTYDFSGSNKWNEMLDSLGFVGTVQKKFKDYFDEWEPQLCVGDIDLETFVQKIQEHLPISFPENYSMLDDFVHRFEQNQGLTEVVQQLSIKYKLGLLTNMYIGMLDKIQENHLIPPIQWDVIVDSSIVRYRKPQKEIYILAEKLSGYKGENILFIDNREENLFMAKSCGWNTLLYKSVSSQSSNKSIYDFLGM